MPADFQLTLSSNAASVVRQLNAFPPAMLQAIAGALDLENELTVGQAQRMKMSKHSATTLGVITNRLRQSLRPTKAIIAGQAVISAIGSNVKYAAVHEFGFTGTVNVPQYTRHDSRRDVYAAGASAHFSWKDGKIKRGRSAQPIASGVGVVKAHPMKMHMPERSYIRSTLAERSDAYSRAISAAILTAWNKPPSAAAAPA